MSAEGIHLLPLFHRTFHQTFKHSSGFCVHPMSGTPLNGTTAILYKDACDEGRLKLDLFKLPGMYIGTKYSTISTL